jgi:hypothetical protein
VDAQKAVFVLPLSPCLRVLRAMFKDGATLTGHGAVLAVLGAWAALSFVPAVKRFREPGLIMVTRPQHVQPSAPRNIATETR